MRQALLYGLDRQALSQEVFDGQVIPAHSFLVTTSWAYNPGIKQYPFLPGRASALFNELGWADSDGDGVLEQGGQPVEFTLLTNEEDQRSLERQRQAARTADEAWRTASADVGIEAPTIDEEARHRRHQGGGTTAVAAQIDDPAGHAARLPSGQDLAHPIQLFVARLEGVKRQQTNVVGEDL